MDCSVSQEEGEEVPSAPASPQESSDTQEEDPACAADLDLSGPASPDQGPCSLDEAPESPSEPSIRSPMREGSPVSSDDGGFSDSVSPREGERIQSLPGVNYT